MNFSSLWTPTSSSHQIWAVQVGLTRRALTQDFSPWKTALRKQGKWMSGKTWQLRSGCFTYPTLEDEKVQSSMHWQAWLGTSEKRSPRKAQAIACFALSLLILILAKRKKRNLVQLESLLPCQGRLFMILQDLVSPLCFCHPCHLCPGLCWLGVYANCSAYRILKKLVRWSCIPILLRVFHSLLWSAQSKVLT